MHVQIGTPYYITYRNDIVDLAILGNSRLSGVYYTGIKLCVVNCLEQANK